jgi:hypothetical protein
MKKYLTLFDQKARELAAGSDGLQKIVVANQKDLPQRPDGAWLIGANIQMKYLKK